MLIVENGTGNIYANSYATRAFARQYLEERDMLGAWDNATEHRQNACLILGSAYIERRFEHRFLGTKRFTNIDLPVHAFFSFSENPANGDTIHIGNTNYEFVASNQHQHGAGNEYKPVIQDSLDETLDELVAVINGEQYGGIDHDHPNDAYTAQRLASTANIMVTAKAGVNTSTDAISVITGGDKITLEVFNAITGGQQCLSFPRLYLYDYQGLEIVGIPKKLKWACVEFAKRVVEDIDALNPDPIYEDNGFFAWRVFDKVGPIETQRNYTGMINFRKYPQTDRLLREFISSGSGVSR